MRETDYPYLGYETNCQYDSSAIEANITDWGQLFNDPAAIAAKLQDQPLEVGFAINNDFSYFDGETVLTADDTEYCGNGGHVISIVGYEPCEGECGETTETVDVLYGRYIWSNWSPGNFSWGCEDYEFQCAWYLCCWYEQETTTTT